MLSPCDATHAVPRASTDSPRNCCPTKRRNCCCRTPFTSAYFATLLGGLPRPFDTHAVPSGASARSKGPLPTSCGKRTDRFGLPPRNTNTLSLPKLEIQILLLASAASPCARNGPPWYPKSGDTGTPDRVNCDMLPLPSGEGSQPSQGPHPKLPNHANPRGSTVTPKPVPSRPPPVTGDTGVPLAPSEG